MSDERSHRGAPRPAPPRSVEEDVEREVRAHIDMRAEELIGEGWEPEAARRQARRSFGDVPRIAAECREITQSMSRHQRRLRRLSSMIDALLQDLRYALRSLSKSPGFTFIGVLTLALGIGANTAIFSVVNGVLLAPLPLPDADRLVVIWEHGARGTDTHVAWPNFVDWQDGNTTLEAMAFQPTYAFGGTYTVLGGERATRLRAGAVSAHFFEIVGVEPVVGRLPRPEEFPPAGEPVLVVSNSFWQTQLGGDTDLSDRTLQVSTYELPVVAVMPPGFRFPNETDLWLAGYGSGDSRTSHNYAVIAKLREGVTVEQADQELDAITASLKEQLGDDMDAVGVNVRSLRDELVGDLERPLYLLLGAAVLVLLVACTNIASTLLARGAARQREVAIRASVGAGRGRLLLQLLIESVVLATAGAIVGLLLAQLVMRGLLATGPGSIPRLEEIGLDAGVLGFTALLTLLTALVFGLLPALRSSQTEVVEALRHGSRGVVGERSGRLWKALVGSEVALALVLLIGAGLLIQSFAAVLAVDMGFDPGNVLTVDVSLPTTLFSDDASMAAFYERLMADLRTIPGVESAGIVNHIPLGGAWINGAFRIEGRRDEDGGYAEYRVASGGYFEAMDIPLVRGRLFEASDRAGAPAVVVVNHALVDRFFPGENPLGQRIGPFANDSWVYEEAATIVGVVGDVRHNALTAEPRPETYVPYLQRPMRIRSAIVTLEVTGDPNAFIGTVRDHIRQLDDRVPMEFSSMEDLLGRSVAGRRATMSILGAFGAVALLLSAVGIYGVVSYSVARRTREMGIRIALGAEPRRVRRLVIRHSMGMVLAGVAVGVAGALAITRLLDTMLYEVSPTDPLTFAGVSLLLIATAGLASFVPALRVSRVDPMITMRDE